MNSFSNDVDILKYEPSLFGDLHFAGQVLIEGDDGQVNGTVFTSASADFTAAKIAAGMVIYLQSSDGVIDGAFEIVSADSPAQLTISVLRADERSDAIALPDAQNLNYRICTYGAQSREVFLQLTGHFGLRPRAADGEYSADDILDVSILRQVSVYGVLSIVFAALTGRADESKENFWKKSEYYSQLYQKALQRCRVCIDLGGDKTTDTVRSGASVRLLRV
jgi:hypothetical protein